MGKTKDIECSKEQALMYTGAAATATYCVTSVLCPKEFEKAHWGKLEPTPAGCAGEKHNKQWHSFCLAGVTAFQTMEAYEKPSVTSLAVTGSMWCGVAALMGVHAFKDKATKPEIAIPSMAAQTALGTLMITRAVQMHRKDQKGKK